MTGAVPLPGLDRDMSQASDEQLLRVVGLIDTLDRRGPVDRVLEPVRARLALLRPPRPLTLGRVLILPFEDLLVPPDEAWPGRRCFSRAFLAQLVEQVTTGLPAPTAKRLRALADGHSMISGDVVREIGATLWPTAAAIARATVDSEDFGVELREQLAGVWPLLELGPTLVPIIWQLPPRPMSGLARPAQDQVVELSRAATPIGEAALQSVLELLLTRAASPLVVLEPLRGADIGLPPRERDAVLGQLVHRRVADMRETAARLAKPVATGNRPNANALLRLVADLDALESKWPLPPSDRTVLGEIRRSVSAFVGTGIETAVRQEILGQLDALARPEGLSDEHVEVLEEAARHTRRLGIAGAKLGLAATPDSLLSRFLPPLQETIRAGRPNEAGKTRAVLLDQVRIVEILFGAEAAIQLYNEIRREAAPAAAK